jgi:microcystin-dependent protein
VAIGTVFWFISEDAPEGAMVCNGAFLNPATYPDLYSLIGYAFGEQSGNFAIPDLRGVFVRGAAPGLSIADSGGEAEHTLTASEMPEHSHALQAAVMQDTNSGSAAGLKWNAVPTLQTIVAGGGQPHNNLPPFTVLVPCIQVS